MEISLEIIGELEHGSDIKDLTNWNSSAPNRGFPSIRSVTGYLDNYEGSIDILFRNGHKMGYSYRIEPSGKRSLPDSHIVYLNQDHVEAKEIQDAMESYGSISLGLLKIYETKFPSLEDIQNSYNWIKVKQFKEEDYPTLEEKYEALKLHHQEETEFLIKKVRELHKQLTK